MKKDTVIKKLNKAFGGFKFFPEDHHYELDGERIKTSVTAFIEEYGNEFEAEVIAKNVAKKENKTVEEVLEEWNYKNEFACHKGSTSHEYVQSLFTGELWVCDNFDFSPEYHEALYKTKKLADMFYDVYNGKLDHIVAEQIVGSKEFDIAGSVDGLFIEKTTGKLILVDYKTNTYITGYNKDAFMKPLKAPLQELNDDKLTHYKLQLSIYRYIIEKYTDLKIERMFIVYMSELNDDYEIIDIPYLKNEVEDILEWRKWE